MTDESVDGDRIQRVRCYVKKLKEGGLAFRQGGRVADLESVIVRVTTQSGTEGWAEGHSHGCARSVAEAICSCFAPLLLGRSAGSMPSDVWEQIRISDRMMLTPPIARGILDAALWDLCGRVRGEDMGCLVGRRIREDVVACASTPVYGTKEEYLSKVRCLVDNGYRAIKIHVAGSEVADLEVAESVRRVVADSIVLIYDAIGSYSLGSALRVGHALEQLGYLWFEEPLEEYDRDAYRRLCDNLAIPVAAGETLWDAPAEYGEFAQATGIDILRPGILHGRGVTGSAAALTLAKRKGIKCELHSYGVDYMLIATLKVLAVTNIANFVEVGIPRDACQGEELDGLQLSGEGRLRIPYGVGVADPPDWLRVERSAELVAAVERRP